MAPRRSQRVGGFWVLEQQEVCVDEACTYVAETRTSSLTRPSFPVFSYFLRGQLHRFPGRRSREALRSHVCRFGLPHRHLWKGAGGGGYGWCLIVVKRLFHCNRPL